MAHPTTDDPPTDEASRLDDAHRNALEWIVERFEEAGVPHQLAGGAAARIYGAERPLRDLDFYVPDGALDDLVPHIEPYVTYGPEREHGDLWRLTYLKARYLSVLIEVADANTASYRDVDNGAWRPASIDFDASTVVHINGVEVSVMPKSQLITYKRSIDRPEDREDVRQMEGKAGG
jgi:hypothetical protein